MAVCPAPSHSASRPTGHPKQRSPSSNSSTKCAISSWPYTRPNSRTPRENDGNPRQRSRRSSQTTNCHSDRRYQLTNGAIGPVLCFGSTNPSQRLLRRRRSRAVQTHQRKTTDLHWRQQTPASLLTSAASPSTSSSQTRPAQPVRTATALLWPASTTCLKVWLFHSIEQPWFALPLIGGRHHFRDRLMLSRSQVRATGRRPPRLPDRPRQERRRALVR